MLSPRVFDVRVSNFLLLNYLADAPESSRERFANMERMLLRVVVASELTALEKVWPTPRDTRHSATRPTPATPHG